jgi:alpha-beta hydrolase superfamily lysophospholipase
MQRSERRDYNSFDLWRRYQDYLSERMRLTEGREPTEEWWSWRGCEIHLDRFAAPSASLTLVLLHGGGGYGRLLAPFGRLLWSHGFEVVLPDLPGYGLSVAQSKMFSYERWVDCAADLVDAEARRASRPVALFGLSVGGYIAYLAAAKGRNAAGVIATTLADPRLPIVKDQLAKNPRLNRLLSPILPPIVAIFGGVKVPVRWFSNMEGLANNPELNRMLCHDPLGGGNRVPLRFLQSLLAVKPTIEPENFDLCPVLLAHPTADRWTTLEASKPFFERIKAPKELVMLENCGHIPIEEPGVSTLELAATTFLSRLAGGSSPKSRI